MAQVPVPIFELNALLLGYYHIGTVPNVHLHKSQNLEALEAQNRAVDTHNGAWRLEMEPWRVIDQWSQIPITFMRSRIRIRIEEKSWIRVRIEMMRIRNPDSEAKNMARGGGP